MTPSELWELRTLLVASWWKQDLAEVTRRFNALRGIAP